MEALLGGCRSLKFFMQQLTNFYDENDSEQKKFCNKNYIQYFTTTNISLLILNNEQTKNVKNSAVHKLGTVETTSDQNVPICQ